MRPKLFIHIGHNKVASSTLQLALRANADAIRSNGILIADEAFGFPTDGAIQGHPLYKIEEIITATDEKKAQHEMDELETRILAALQDERFRGAVISSENLTSARASCLFGSLSRRFDLKVLYLIRRQDEYLVSAWKQWGVRKGQSLNAYVEERLQNHSPKFLNIALDWKKQGADVRVIPLHAVKDIPALTYEWLGIEDSTPVQVPRTNETYDYSILDVLSHNPFVFSGTSDNSIFVALNSLLPKNLPKASAQLLAEETRLGILEHFKEENAQLHEQFTGSYLPLDQYPDKEKSEPPIDLSPENKIYRYLGMNLLMIKSLHERTAKLSVLSDPSLSIDKIPDIVHKLTAENKELQSSITTLTHRINKLENQPLFPPRFLRWALLLLGLLTVIFGIAMLSHYF